MNIPPQALKPKKGQWIPPGTVLPQPVTKWKWVTTQVGDVVVAGGNRQDVYPGYRAEVTDSLEVYHVYAIGQSITVGCCDRAERRVAKEGGPKAWLQRVSQNFNASTVSAPCVNTFQDGGDQVFLVMVHQPTIVKVGNTKKYLKEEIYEDFVGTAPTEPECRCDINAGHKPDCAWKQYQDWKAKKKK